MSEPRIDSLHDPFEDQLSAARYMAERDAAVQELQAMREHDRALWMECHAAQECLACEEEKAKRLGCLVWRLQNRLARAHRRERNLRKGMREWREKAISGPVRTVSAYDLLPEEDRETLRWVREKGGLENVGDVWDEAVNLCATIGCEPNDASEMLQALGDCTDVVIKRLMPEGYEWPRYESGELVDVGDNVIGRFSADAIKVRSVEFVKGKTYLREGCKTDRAVLVCTGVRVKHPAVPAGDGEPLEVGQTVWNTAGTEFKVLCIRNDTPPVELKDRDGRPHYEFPDRLTHTKPEQDSWEKIEKDAMDIDLTLDSEWGGNPTDARDLVRRAKALAERGE